MRFHVDLVVRDNFDPRSAVPVQKMIFAWLNELVKSGKAKEHGIYSDDRGGFLIVDAESPEELFRILGPVEDVVMFRAHPYVSAPTLKSFFDAFEKSMKK